MALTVLGSEILNRTISVLSVLTAVDLTTANTRGPVTLPNAPRGAMLLYVQFDTFSVVGAGQPLSATPAFQFGTDSTTTPSNMAGSTTFPAGSVNPFIYTIPIGTTSPYLANNALYFRIGTPLAAYGNCNVTFFGCIL
jgi:hypothetical protein